MPGFLAVRGAHLQRRRRASLQASRTVGSLQAADRVRGAGTRSIATEDMPVFLVLIAFIVTKHADLWRPWLVAIFRVTLGCLHRARGRSSCAVASLQAAACIRRARDKTRGCPKLTPVLDLVKRHDCNIARCYRLCTAAHGCSERKAIPLRTESASKGFLKTYRIFAGLAFCDSIPDGDQGADR